MTLFDSTDKQTILGAIPSKSNSYIIVTLKEVAGKKRRATLIKSHRLKKYEQAFNLQCNVYRNKNIQGPFVVEVDVFFPTRLSDLDNCLKILMDCLERVGAFENDNNCIRLVANKFVDPANPRVEFTVKAVG